MKMHPHITHYHWSVTVLASITIAIFVSLLSAPPGSAHGLSYLAAAPVVLPDAHNVTPLEKIPGVKSDKDAAKGKSLKEQCQAKVAKQYWGACCSPPDYTTSEACQNTIKGKPTEKPPAEKQQQPAEQGGGEQPLKPAELKLLPVAWQKEYSQINKQANQYEVQAKKVQAEINTMAKCELGCPGGARAIQCTQENVKLCIDHDKCITACDKGYPQLEAKIKKLQRTEADLTKKATAYMKKVKDYKAKNQKKFRAIEGASR